MQKYLAILIVIVCTVLLQAHSIPFWLEQSNSYIGYLWSFTIEGVALWLWLNKKMILAIIASAIIILVPLMQLSKPLLKEIRLLNANTEIKKLNSLSISQSEKLQDKYLTTNWAGTINKNTTYLRSAIESQKDLYTDGSKLKSVYENIFIIVLQSVALMVVLLTQIQALRLLSFQGVSSLKYDEMREKWKPIKKELRDKKRSFNAIQRRIIFRRAKGKCEYCSCKLVWDIGSKRSFQSDHVIPHSMGGETKLSNSQALCSNCNSKKGNKLWDKKTTVQKIKNIQIFKTKQIEHMTPLELLNAIDSYIEKEVITYSTLASESGISKSFFTRLKARVNGDESAVTNVLLKSAEEKFLVLKNKKEIK